jgi:endophilin-A
MPPSGSGKDKILYTEAVGLVMIDYGDAVVGGFGKSTSERVLYMRALRG